VDVGKVL